MNKWLGNSWVFIVVVGAFAAGLLSAKVEVSDELIEAFAACALAASGVVSGKWAPGWEMLSAIGTIAAVCVALGIALRDGREKRKRDQFLARVVASGLLVPMLEFQRFLSSMEKDLLLASNDFDAYYPQRHAAVRERFRKLEFPYSEDNVIDLSFYPDETAELLIWARAELEKARSLFGFIDLNIESVTCRDVNFPLCYEGFHHGSLLIDTAVVNMHRRVKVLKPDINSIRRKLNPST